MNKRMVWTVAVLALWGCGSHEAGPSQDPAKMGAGSQMRLNDKPLTANTRFAAGQLDEAQGAFDVAIVEYQEALKLDPKHQPTLFRLGIVYTVTQQFDPAIEIWQRYIKVTQGSAAAYSNLAFCYEQAGRFDDAKKAYETGIAKEPKSVVCRTNYGLMLARQGHVPEAVRIWQPVLSEAEIHYNLASVFQLQGRKAAARAEYQKALELDPKMVEARTRLAGLDAK